MLNIKTNMTIISKEKNRSSHHTYVVGRIEFSLCICITLFADL